MNKKGFVLIEFLIALIIQGTLMLIAIPKSTKYIDDSKKDSYVSTVKILGGNAMNLALGGNLDLYDVDTTYYINTDCLSKEYSYTSPYGDFVKAYIVVTFENEGYNYFFTGVDEEGNGVKDLINIRKLDTYDIKSNVSASDITTDRGIDNRSKIVIINDKCEKGEPVARTGANISSTSGEEIE